MPKAQPFSNRKTHSAAPLPTAGNGRRDFLSGPRRERPLVALFSHSGAHRLSLVSIAETGDEPATRLKDSNRFRPGFLLSPGEDQKARSWRFLFACILWLRLLRVFVFWVFLEGDLPQALGLCTE